jgi:hypothetical protein
LHLLDKTTKYSPFFAAAAVLCIGVWLLYPWYQYYIDPDATAYLTIAKRYASGDYNKAINGYWSPWSIWLTAGLIKTGLNAFPSAIIVNTLGAVGFLLGSQSLAALLRVKKGIQWLMAFTLALFLVYAVYKQTFSDLWMCAFLLIGLRIMLYDSFTQKPVLWILLGVTGALSYFAKQYGFHFFILNTIICSFFITQGNRKQWLTISATAILVMITISLPWIYQLHEKYGAWMTGTAGKLNLSWYLLGHPVWKDGIDVLLPPVYADSPYYWEDPWWVNGATPHFYNSAKLFALQVVKVVYNVLKLVQSMGAISVFYAVVWLLAVSMALSKKLREELSTVQWVTVVSFLIFPLSFLLINFEPRYIWYTLPLSFIIGAWGVQHIQQYVSPLLQRVIIWVLALSYLVTPVREMQEMFRDGQDAYDIAQVLQQEGIIGSFATNVNSGADVHYIERIAYHSGNAYYNMPVAAVQPLLLKDMRRYGVKYFYYLYRGNPDSFIFYDEQGHPFPVVYNDGRLQIFEIK